MNQGPKWKQKKQRKANKYSFDFSRINNPIQDQITSPDDLKYLYTNGVIPYSKYNTIDQDSLLDLLNRFRFLSPTLGACHISIKSYITSGKLKLRKASSPDFDFGIEIPDPSPEDTQRTIETLQNISYNKQTLLQTIDCVFDDFFDNGNYYLELIITTVGTVSKYLINYHHSSTVKKWYDKDGKVWVLISPKWDQQYLKTNPPQILPLAPEFTLDTEGTGIRRTLIHIKHGNYPHYGRPIWAAALIPGYREYQDGDYLTKTCDSFFTGQMIFEYEGQDEEVIMRQTTEEVGQSFADQLRDNFTAQSDEPRSILVAERPYGATPLFVHEVKVNTNENFFEKESVKNRKQIFENLSWSERLLGNIGASGFTGDAYYSELEVKDAGILQFFREYVTKGFKIAYELCYELQYGSKPKLEPYIPKIFDQGGLSNANTKLLLDAYGVGVRAGAITPTTSDEIFFRNKTNFPDMTDEVLKAWERDGNVRRPITPKSQDEIDLLNQDIANNTP